MQGKKIKITIIKNYEKQEFFTAGGEQSLFSFFRDRHIFVEGSCGGRGLCKKCRVKFLLGATAVTEQDRIAFTLKELEEGWRLACLSCPKEDCTVQLEAAAEIEAITQYYGSTEACDAKRKPKKENSKEQTVGIAIDIGTTTVAFELIDSGTGSTLGVCSRLNGQRQYGADVMSRIQASCEGKKEVLQRLITAQLWEGICTLLTQEKKQYSVEKLEQIVISANTTMVHLLMGYSCEKLGVYPFIPQNLEQIQTDTCALGMSDKKIPVKILPGISAYIGGDILCGLSLLGFDKKGQGAVLLDLGTNAEMALYDGKQTIYVTSAAAGPAFEGGNISCGTGSIPGAVSHVKIEETGIQTETIGNLPPVGICGSGVLELLYELHKNGIIDETGLLKDAYFDSGYTVAKRENAQPIILTQQDIRTLQMAKAAIRAALDILMKKGNISETKIEKLYLAGGFGYQLDLIKAAAVGLFPMTWVDKIQSVGNTSLEGAAAYIRNQEKAEEMQLAGKNCRQICQEIYLANEPEFESAYLDNMYL